LEAKERTLLEDGGESRSAEAGREAPEVAVEVGDVSLVMKRETKSLGTDAQD